MPGAPPGGGPVPADGKLEPAALDQLSANAFGIYVHVPFCASRCGYCDFNTYTAAELGGGGSRASYAGQAIEEIRFARRVLGPLAPAVSTVFFGGGTPTLLPPADLAAILRAIASEFGLRDGAEVTTEANPESVDQRSLAELRSAGFTRISFGMQSSASHVLAVLDRAHSPGRAEQCVAWARSAGFRRVSLDLIYGTPGESTADWEHSVRCAIGAGPDHVSAYALIVETGTRLAARIRRGELAPPDDDEMADRYLAAEELLSAAGLTWYEISNWAAGPESACKHNLLYWTGGNWWGVGPGAHSHVGGTRWWNVRHPSAYAERIAAGASPGQAMEVLTGAERATERIMLTTRLASGCDLAELGTAGLRAAEAAVADGLADRRALEAGRVVLTPAGRLLADAVIRGLTDLPPPVARRNHIAANSGAFRYRG
jgi:oxygen-independent coproporphyrinogen-3 oxidase